MTDPLVELESLTPNIAAALEARRLEHALGRASEKLAEVPRQAARLRALIDAVIALEATNDPTIKRALREAVDEAEDIGELLQGARTADNLQYVSEDLPKLIAALRGLDLTVRQFWKLAVSNEFQSLVSVGALLTRIPTTQDLGARLRTVGQQAQALVDRNPPAEQLAPEIQKLRDTRIALDEELHQLSGNAEVDAFLTAVARDVATLAHITPAVMAWLAQNDALQAFAVRGSG